MSPVVAALVGGAASAGYAPILRRQVRDGEISVPIGGVNPLRIRRDTSPLSFRIAAGVMAALVTLLVVACAVLLIEGLRH